MSTPRNKKSECVQVLLKVGLFKKERSAVSFLVIFSLCAIVVSVTFFLSFIVVPTNKSLAETYGSVDQSIFKNQVGKKVR